MFARTARTLTCRSLLPSRLSLFNSVRTLSINDRVIKFVQEFSQESTAFKQTHTYRRYR